MNDKSIYTRLVAAGIPIDHHESDLYAKVSPKSHALVVDYVHKSNVRIFVSQTDGTPWFDIPFAYDPFWESKPA